MYGLVHYHQNTKQIFIGLPVTKDTKTLKQHQQFFLECIDLISEDVNVPGGTNFFWLPSPSRINLEEPISSGYPAHIGLICFSVSPSVRL
jgi:hypothetical protein